MNYTIDELITLTWDDETLTELDTLNDILNIK